MLLFESALNYNLKLTIKKDRDPRYVPLLLPIRIISWPQQTSVAVSFSSSLLRLRSHCLSLCSEILARRQQRMNGSQRSSGTQWTWHLVKDKPPLPRFRSCLLFFAYSTDIPFPHKFWFFNIEQYLVTL